MMQESPLIAAMTFDRRRYVALTPALDVRHDTSGYMALVHGDKAWDLGSNFAANVISLFAASRRTELSADPGLSIVVWRAENHTEITLAVWEPKLTLALVVSHPNSRDRRIVLDAVTGELVAGDYGSHDGYTGAVLHPRHGVGAGPPEFYNPPTEEPYYGAGGGA